MTRESGYSMISKDGRPATILLVSTDCGVQRSLAAFSVRLVSQFRAPHQGSPTKLQAVWHAVGWEALGL